jgi:Multiubiquitin
MKGQKMSDQKLPIQSHDDDAINIQIDRVHYRVNKKSMTGAELRHVASPSIPVDRDLFQVVPGGPDRKVGDADLVELHNGARFFTAPGHINPGKTVGV